MADLKHIEATSKGEDQESLITGSNSLISESNVAIRATNLSKVYKLYQNPQARLKEALDPFRRKYHREFYALKNISFEVKKGEVLGIIGKNGAGKSTLLSIISGLVNPTYGTIQVNGNISALLELGSGFNPEATGIENVYFWGSIMGFNRDEMAVRLGDVLSFADIGDFVNQPVKMYSSGMILRLAFALQTCLEPDVLIVDEILSVGDIFFQQKCHARMEELIAHNTAVVIVSHNMQAIERYSTKVMLVDRGCCSFLGQPNEAVQRFYSLRQNVLPESEIASRDRANLSEPNMGAGRHEFSDIPDWPQANSFIDLSQTVVIGQEDVARCSGIAICNQQGKPCNEFQIGEVAYFYYEFEVLKDIEVPLGGLNITNRMNIVVHAKNSLQSGVEAPTAVRKDSRVRFCQTMELNIAPDEYTFAVSFATICAADYAHSSEIDYDKLHTKIQSILRVRQAGKFIVKRGLALPFYGYIDLKGGSQLSILSAKNDTKAKCNKMNNTGQEALHLPPKSFYLASFPRSGNTWLLYSLSMLFKAIRSVACSEFDLYPHRYSIEGQENFYLKTEDKINMSRPLIIKTHQTREIYDRLYPKAKCIYIYRDGRDVLLSFYFYNKAFSIKEQIIVERIGKKRDLTSKTLKKVDFDAEEFTDFLYRHTREWGSHVKKWFKADGVFSLRYEDLYRDFEGMLVKLIDYLGIETHSSVADVTKEYVVRFRPFFSGDNRQFFRKGIIGDWKNYYTKKHIRIFSEFAGDLLIKLGYEQHDDL